MLFRNPRSAVIAIALFLLLLLVVFATKCRAADIGFEAGRTVIHGEAPSIALSLSFGDQRNVGVDHQDFNYEFGLVLNDSNGLNPKNFGAQCLIVDRFRKFDLGFGIVYLQTVDQWNDSHTNLSLLARYKITDRWSVAWRHWSNSGVTPGNIGRDMVLVAFKF